MSNATTPTRIAVIMAGGSGERFWPLSRRRMPKQLLRLTKPDQTLLAEAVERMAPVIPPERVFVATALHLRDAVCRAKLGIADENVLAEPCKRNTAGCLVYAAAHVLNRFREDGPNVTMAVVTADHTIGDADRFRATVQAAMAAAEAEDALVMIGIRPSRPATGYGYIEIPADAAPTAGSSPELPVFPVTRFREKPDLATAREFIRTGRFFWNSGMFFWRLSAFLDELEAAAPALARAVHAIAQALGAGDHAKVNATFQGLKDISIDFALMEHVRRVLMVRGDFPWDDVGSWDALDRSMPHDEEGNVCVGAPVLVDTRGCIVYNAAGPDRMAVSVLGCENLVVVACGDGVLVAPKARAQEVKRIVAALKEQNASQL